MPAELPIPLDELAQIRENYEKGKYAHLSDCLTQFLINHAQNIIAFRRGYEQLMTQLPLETAISLYILDNKTRVSMKLDMRDQYEEMLKEVWIQRERNSRALPAEIEKEWVKKYAEAWRVHRTREIVYVFSRDRERYLELLK